ncbi:Iron(III) dicitrate transport system permease protein FecD (TC 3.A.1.14.1) [Vagococcus fluvialis bH819]|uniref:Iron(III) dicitrate transport system permease protein FecD (TC 3.A.1.14.1) n=1 Tax=Vagococcus fluvialis bH819 TaxID=1255619 RepID=A0A1X6WKN4_9ENTE|nr:Iron(III) dicitrate transport system permease protein FecD (TC 3.A.1.14.1) [Vagococcus fluvialis bH819]
MFWKHSKQHSSKTCKIYLKVYQEFWKHSKQHSSKTKKTLT